MIVEQAFGYLILNDGTHADLTGDEIIVEENPTAAWALPTVIAEHGGVKAISDGDDSEAHVLIISVNKQEFVCNNADEVNKLFA